jgi:NDP-sugar pyrophosphorylase family protein
MIGVILAGGYGKRLRPLTEDRPKPLIEVAGKPILQRQIEWLRNYNVDSVILLGGYKWEVLVSWVTENSNKLGINVSFSIEKEPLGTAGALKRVENLLKREKEFFMLNGDIISNIELSKLSLGEKHIGAIALVPLKSTYGIVDVDGDDIISFREKPILQKYYINAGIYLLSSKIFDYLPEKGDLEKLVFPKLAEERKLRGVKFDGVYWRSIDTVKDLEEATNELSNTE